MNRLSKSTVCLLASCLALLSDGQLQADTYKIDVSHTSIIFGINHFNYSYTYGRFIGESQRRLCLGQCQPVSRSVSNRHRSRQYRLQ